MAALQMATMGFKEPALLSYLDGSDSEFEDHGNRQMRYKINWASYENTLYRDIQKWATAYKSQYGLYKYTRNIYSPAYRLGEFYKSYLWGGRLANDASNTGAIPIQTANDAIREPIAEIWKWSNWDINKDVCTLWGTILGDVFIKVIDSPDKRRVYYELVYPGYVRDVTLDAFNNVKAYTIQYQVEHPEDNNKPAAIYTEVVYRDSEQEVVYETYLNDESYGWYGMPASWSVPYGFVPLVAIQHNDVGQDWGHSEIHAARAKMHELDDVATMLSDQIRKSVNVKWLFKGVTPDNMEFEEASPTTARPEPYREQENAIYVGKDADAMPLVAELDIEGVMMHITSILDDLEKDYPELGLDARMPTAEISGRAIRMIRQPTDQKVRQRRVNYDKAIVKANQMGLAIGGYRGYFAGFNLDSYKAGALEHNISNRPVFEADALDVAEVANAEWMAAAMALSAGVSLKGYLQHQGMPAEEIDKLLVDSVEPSTLEEDSTEVQ